MPAKLTIEEMQTLAANKGGKCLSTEYINTRFKLEWQCAKNHIWFTTAYVIKGGFWCPICSNHAKLTIENIHDLARKLNLTLLSTEYKNARTKMQWKCKNEHVFEKNVNSVKNNKGCAQCYGKLRLNIEVCKIEADKNKGKCLSNIYINSKTKMTWQCKNGHVWQAFFRDIRRGNWCFDCRKLTIEEMHLLAKEHNGKCLSDEYIDNSHKLLWECNLGHQWKAAPANIKVGCWCQICSRLKTENFCRSVFEEKFGYKFPPIKAKWLMGNKNRPLELDGYCEELKLAFEYNGRQHYELVSAFKMAEEDLLYTQERDAIKVKKCKDEGVTLVVIPTIRPTNKKNVELTILSLLNELNLLKKD